MTAPGPAKALPAVSVCVCPARRPQGEAVPGGRKRGGGAEPGQDEQHGGPEGGAARPAQRDPAPGRPGSGDGTGTAGRPDRKGHRGARGAGEPAEEAEHQARAGQVRAPGDRRARVGEEESERHDALPGGQQRADPQPGAAERDEHGARGPDGQVDRVGDQVVGLPGHARPVHVVREQPGDPQRHAQAEQQGRHQAAAAAAACFGRRGEPLAGRAVLGGPGGIAARRGDRVRRLQGSKARPRGGPALLGFRPPFHRLRPGRVRGPEPEVVAPASYLVRCAAGTRWSPCPTRSEPFPGPASAHPVTPGWIRIYEAGL